MGDEMSHDSHHPYREPYASWPKQKESWQKCLDKKSLGTM